MIRLLDVIGPAVGRASWQAALLAVIVALTLWPLRERVTPRWRYLLWSVVVLRLLCLVTPASPWSAFNLARFDAGGDVPAVVVHESPRSEAADALERGSQPSAVNRQL